jgi:hypothetical protein
MLQLLWTGRFLMEQGFHLKETILYQDNTSSILIEKNGCSSCSKRSRHMDIRYFFIKEQVDMKRVKIEMVADYFTKPLQGGPFRKLRDYIMNIDPSSMYHSNNSVHRSVLSTDSHAVGSCDITNSDLERPRTYTEALMSPGPSVEVKLTS